MNPDPLGKFLVSSGTGQLDSLQRADPVRMQVSDPDVNPLFLAAIVGEWISAYRSSTHLILEISITQIFLEEGIGQ